VDWESDRWPSDDTPAAFEQWLASRLDMLPGVEAIWRHLPQRDRRGRDRRDSEAAVAGRFVRDAYRVARLLRDRGFAQVADDEQPGRTYSLHDAELIVRQIHRQTTAGWSTNPAKPSTPQNSAGQAVVTSADFRSMRWGVEQFAFTEKQAACVRVLWDARERGAPELSQVTILGEAESAMVDERKPQLRKLFKDHPAWGTLIVKGSTRGTYRLAEPAS
jgi:hypothetical protein